jgi:hypothetical protein
MMRHGRCDKGAGGHRRAEDLDHCWGVLLGAFMAVAMLKKGTAVAGGAH